MIKIIRFGSRSHTIQYTVQENPTPGSFGDYLLLKQYYRELDESRAMFGSDPKRSKIFEQLLFNTEFLNSRLKEYSELHCEYCGKQNLVIFHWTTKPDKAIMATCDHILPRSTHPHLAKDMNNCAVACDDCNQRKKTKVWQKCFPYKKKTNEESINNRTSITSTEANIPIRYHNAIRMVNGSGNNQKRCTANIRISSCV